MIRTGEREGGGGEKKIEREREREGRERGECGGNGIKTEVKKHFL